MREDDVIRRAKEAAKQSTPATAYRDYLTFVEREMAEYKWRGRLFPYRIVDRLLGRKQP